MAASGQFEQVRSELGCARRRFHSGWIESEQSFRGKYRANAEVKLVTPLDLACSRLEAAVEELAAAATIAERMLA